jgi:hypothetical protein
MLLILRDIRWFLVPFCIFIAAFFIAFLLVGLNQLETLALEAAETGEMLNEPPIYAFPHRALFHVYLIAVGDFSVDQYLLGKREHQIILHLLFVLGSFSLVIHMLNMLVAIMGDTFERNKDVKDIQNFRSHLRFVLDSRYLGKIENY